MTNADSKILSGLHILLVEDQALIALDTEAMLRELGAAQVEAMMSERAAFDWLASVTPHVGVLDINLGGSASFGVAEELARRKVPFIFTTGYGDGLIVPAPFAGVEVVYKPYTCAALQQALSACLGAPPVHV